MTATICARCGHPEIRRHPKGGRICQSWQCQARRTAEGNLRYQRELRQAKRGTSVRARDVFERDGWRCYLCGRSTPEHLLKTSRGDGPTLDHVIPLSRGGTHDMANLRCCCRACNAGKSNRTPEEYAKIRARRPNPAVSSG